MTSITKYKIGFIVINDIEKIFVEEVTKRIFVEPSISSAIETASVLNDDVINNIKIHTIRLGSESAVPWIYGTIFDLLNLKYDHIIIITNYRTEYIINNILSTYRFHKNYPKTVIRTCSIDSINFWLFPDFVKQELIDINLKNEIATTLIKYINFEKLCKFSWEFNHFYSIIMDIKELLLRNLSLREISGSCDIRSNTGENND